MTSYDGFTAWVEEATTYPVFGAIIARDKVSIDASSDGYDYSMVMRPAPKAGVDRWVGRWRLKDGSSGHIDARLYRASDGRVALVGHWTEDGCTLRWVTELSPH